MSSTPPSTTRRRPRLPIRPPLLALATALLAACGGEAAPPAAADAARGQLLFQRACATCHGADAEGIPRLGADLRDNAFVAELSDDELVEFLAVGRSARHPLNTRGVDMPPRGGDPTLDDTDLAAIAAYLRTL